MNALPAMFRLFRMPLRRDPDVVLCRNRARMVAEKFGFQRQDQIRIATAVSEIARNAFRYAEGASAEFHLETCAETGRGKRNPQTLTCIIRDTGPGIANLEEVLSGNYRSTTGMGMGITGAHRLMDKVGLETGPGGTVVHLRKELPRGKSITRDQVRAIAEAVAGPGFQDPVEELAAQNNEMLFMLGEIGEKGAELSKVNEELSETNRGVVALYDELDTIYRVGHVLASKLELDDLLQAIIDATTEICGAELGIFACEENDTDGRLRQHTAGTLASALRGSEPIALAVLMAAPGDDSPPPQLLRVDDLAAAGPFPSPLASDVIFRSYLAVPVLSSGEKLVGAMVFAHRDPAFFTDRSERILASVALQASVGIENARLYKSVRSASAAKDQFLAILSHELRNPLNPIFARLTLLEENPAMPPEALEDISLIRRNLELETRLIDDLLDMTRIARGKIVVRKEPVDLHSVVEAARHACSGLAARQNVEVVFEPAAEGCAVLGDAVRLQQVFWNLLNNAIKFSSPGSRVFVRTARTGPDRMEAVVIDSGKGIPPHRVEAIFQAFEQEGAGVADSHGGLGLGLAICRSIVLAHEGMIQAESDGPGRGSVFRISLPLTLEAPAESPIRPAARSAVNRPAVGLRILLVDDHEDTRISFKTLLERRGHLVTTAASLAEARAAADKTRFQLLVSDIGLPDGSGCDLMRGLRDSDPDLQGIAVSGYGMPGDLERSHDAGFALHLTKPLRIASLDQAIAQVAAAG